MDIKQAARLADATVEALRKELGDKRLDAQTLRVFALVASGPDQGTSYDYLVDKTGSNLSTLSRIVIRLSVGERGSEALHLVTRDESEEDRRYKVVRLTNNGKEAWRRIARRIQEQLSRLGEA